MLIELFSWLAEAMMYRTNRVPISSVETFLKMLNGTSMAGLSLKDAQARTVLSLRERYRAVTADDFEALVLTMNHSIYTAARVKCLPELNLTAADPYTERTGHVSLILVPQSEDPAPIPDQGFIDAVTAFLDERRLITTKVHVVKPVYVSMFVWITVAADPSNAGKDLYDRVSGCLKRFFHPLHGGPDGTGWPFGRPVYASEVYQAVEGITGVDHVESLYLFTDDNGYILDRGERIDIGKDSLIRYLDTHEMNLIRIIEQYE
jgi:predicted phage baseplate assembly protein